MKKGQTSIRNGIQDVLCPFTDWYCTAGADDSFSHRGSEANDIVGISNGVKYPYYAPVDVKCVRIDRNYAFVWWQSIEKVRLATGKIDYVTFLCGHDNTINCYEGQIIKQGVQLGNMGDAGIATGVHCHIEVGLGKQNTWIPNEYGTYCIPNQIPLEDAFFMDNTNIIRGIADWKYLNDVSINSYLNLSPKADTWAIYDLDVLPVLSNVKTYLTPSKYDGLSYTILGFADDFNTAIIETLMFGKVKIYIKHEYASITDYPIYQLVK